jgi:transposase
MTANLFWFSDEQWLRIEPHLPMNQPGPECKDDRRILSGIMHVIKVGRRRKDCPPEYGPHKTVYNRFARWSEKGVWQKIFEAVVGSSAGPHQVAHEPRENPPMRDRRKGGAEAQAIGMSQRGSKYQDSCDCR